MNIVITEMRLLAAFIFESGERVMLRQGERFDQLFRERMEIIQSKDAFAFSVDALLMANFMRLTKRDKRIMDLCSGNGIIPLLLSHRTGSLIEGMEIQGRLVDMAQRSIGYNGKDHQITMHHLDMLDVKSYFTHSGYDAVCVNPPYFTKDQPMKHKGPHSIARHEVHIDLYGVIQTARYLIKNKGRLTIVHRAERSAEVISELHNQGFRVRRVQYVYNDPGAAVAMFVLIEAIFNSQAYGDVLPPFYIYNSDGAYSEGMLEVYYG